MIELFPSQYQAASAFFGRTHYGVLATGTLDGGHPGRVFLDNPADPKTGLVCTCLDYYFLAGQISAPVLDWLYNKFNEDFIPRQKSAIGSADVVLFFEPLNWKEPLFERFVDCQPLLIHKKRHILPEGSAARFSGWQSHIPVGFQVRPYNSELIKSSLDLISNTELFYGSVENFLKRGFGWCILNGDQIASTCWAVFVGGGEVEIDIHTTEAYRRRGLAYLLASSFIEDCLKRGLNPIWGCWPENMPSVRLAKKLGFIGDTLQPACFLEDRKR